MSCYQLDSNTIRVSTVHVGDFSLPFSTYIPFMTRKLKLKKFDKPLVDPDTLAHFSETHSKRSVEV
jgi:hypothetical protein